MKFPAGRVALVSLMLLSALAVDPVSASAAPGTRAQLAATRHRSGTRLHRARRARGLPPVIIRRSAC